MHGAAETLAPHRLALAAAEWTVLVNLADMTPPPGFGATEVDEAGQQEAVQALAARGVVVTDDGNESTSCRPVAAVTVNLAVLADPAVVTTIEVALGARWLRARYTVSGQLGASLFALAEGSMELSLFPATALGVELVRAVPGQGELATAEVTMRHALDPSEQAGAALSGRLPLAVLGEYGPARELAGPAEAASGLDPAHAALAQAVTEQTAGVLRAVVTDATGGVGQVVWLATDAGWVGLRPLPPEEGVAMVELVPVVREEIGTWLAPYLARALEATHG